MTFLQSGNNRNDKVLSMARALAVRDLYKGKGTSKKSLPLLRYSQKVLGFHLFL